jgi:signal transduction histidine kinase
VVVPDAFPADDAPILVVDDEPEVASAIADHLEEEGYRVVTAGTGAEARRIVHDGPVALILLDLHLPDGNGIGLLQELRAGAHPPDVVVVTGHASLQSAVDAIEAGAGGYIEKPMDFKRLRRVVTRSLERRRLAGIFDSTSDGMMLVGTDGQIVSANRQAAELLGFDTGAAEARAGFAAGLGLTGVLVRHFAHEDEFHAAVAPLQAAVGGDGTGEGDLELRLTGRTLHWVARPAGAVAGTAAVALTFHDVTHEREVNRMKSDFVSFVTHQLRTPLAGIRWMLELASGRLAADDEATSFIADARRAAERLIGLVNDLLDVSRIESGTVTLEPSAVDVGDLTRGILAELDGLLREKGHTVEVEGAAGAPAVPGDPQMLRLVVLNLVSNAVKYTPAHGRIGIRIGVEPRHLVWSVRDSGIGVPKEAQRRLFEKFYRADNVRTVETEGTGLGLYLVKLIVDRHGGRVWCESEEGSGAMFAFTLPRDIW